MKSRLIALAVLPALGGAFAPTAHAAVTIPSIQTIETRLCPVGGASSLRLGHDETKQDPELRKVFSIGGKPIAPFEEARAVYTPWSEQLSAIEFNGASPDGDDNRNFIQQMTEQLEANGWVRAEGPKVFATHMMSPVVYTKDLSTADGPRRFLLQFEAPGAVLLNCGGLDLLKLSEAESEEVLAPGSPRPVPPQGHDQPLANLRPQDCDDPAFREKMMARLTAGDRTGATDSMDEASDQERYQSRLRIWLRWKMVESGKINHQALWEIEEKVAPREAAQMEKDFIAFAGSVVAMDKARKRGDAAAECRAMAALAAAETGKSGGEAARLARINAAFEAEAKRLGIEVDS